MNYSINDSIKEAIGQVASNHDLSAYAVMDLFETVTDYVSDYLLDEQFDDSVVQDIEEYMAAAEVVVLDPFGDDEPVDLGDPATLVADAEEFIDGCERADFFVELAYSRNFLTGLRDRLNNILASNG